MPSKGRVSPKRSARGEVIVEGAPPPHEVNDSDPMYVYSVAHDRAPSIGSMHQ